MVKQISDVIGTQDRQTRGCTTKMVQQLPSNNKEGSSCTRRRRDDLHSQLNILPKW